MTVDEFVRRESEKLLESDEAYLRAKRAVLEAEDEHISNLTFEQASRFVIYEERREFLEKQRFRVWTQLIARYYERGFEYEDNENAEL